MESRQELRKKILKGMRKAIRNLIKQEAKEDGYVVLYKNGKVVKVKAKDLLKEKNKTIN